MIINYYLLPYILAGITLITLLNTAGAIASRKLNFNYGFLSPFSFAVYTVIGYLISKNNTIDIVIACNVLIGMFNGIAGWNLSMKFKANVGQTEEQTIEMSEGQRVMLMMVIAGVFGTIGFMIANNVTI